MRLAAAIRQVTNMSLPRSKWTKLKKLLYINRIYQKRVKRPENADVPPAS